MHLQTVVVGSLLSVALALPTTTHTSFQKREVAERDLSGSLTAVLNQALSLIQGGEAGAGGNGREGGVRLSASWESPSR